MDAVLGHLWRTQRSSAGSSYTNKWLKQWTGGLFHHRMYRILRAYLPPRSPNGGIERLEFPICGSGG